MNITVQYIYEQKIYNILNFIINIKNNVGHRIVYKVKIMGFTKSENNETKVVKKYYFTLAIAQYDTKY